MANQLNKFDQLVKNSYEGYEAPYDPLQWEELEEELEFAAPGISSYFSAVTTGMVAVSLVFLSMLFFFSDSGMKNSNHIEEIPPVTILNTDAGSGHSSNEDIGSEETLTTADSENASSEATNSTEKSVKSTKDGLAAAEAEPIKSAKANHKPVIKNTTKMNVTASNENSAEAKVRTGCTGLIINFEAAKEYGEEAKYLWNFGDGYFSNEASPSHTFNKEGVFDVSLSVTSKTTGQISSNVVQAMIEVVEAPVANLDISIDSPEKISLKNDSYNASNLEWILNGKKMDEKSDINLSIADNTRYKVVLNAMNDGGCVDSLEYAINSIAAGGEFPKAMDQTSGHNFAPGAIVDSGKVSSIKIYNKATSELVFEGFGNKGWNGTTLSGKIATKGTYRWLMAVKKSDTVDIYKGDIELR